MVNIGIVGLGFMGLTHIKAYRQIPNARIVALCDAVKLPVDGKLGGQAGNLASTDDIQFDMSVVKGYRDYQEFLANPEIQLVDICLPTPLHAAVAIASLQSGKHVLCEKPLARQVDTCRRILEAARQAKGFFMPAHCLRFWPEWAWLQAAITSGCYGKVLAAKFVRLSEPPGWSQGSYFKGDESGGALLDLHIHDTDFVQFCFGRPRSVFTSAQIRFSGAYDHVVTTYQVASGATVTAEGSWLLSPGHGFKMAYTVIFEQATADYDCTRGAAALKLFSKDQEPRVIACPGGDGYVGELTHMIECIETGQAPHIVTGEDGLRAVEICAAEEASAKTGQLVVLD